MIYLILADIIVAIHFAYVSYVVVGELLIILGILLKWQWIRNFWFRVSHLAMIVVVALEAVVGFRCPLTTWEYLLLDAAGERIERRSFVGRLMHDLMFFDCPDDSWIWRWIYGGVAGVILLTFGDRATQMAPQTPRWNQITSCCRVLLARRTSEESQ